jgi:hypothetical protein
MTLHIFPVKACKTSIIISFKSKSIKVASIGVQGRGLAGRTCTRQGARGPEILIFGNELFSIS